MSIESDNQKTVFQLPYGFIENSDKSEFVLYGDTDSSYRRCYIPVDKTEIFNIEDEELRFKEIDKLTDYLLYLAEKLNSTFQYYFRKTVIERGGVDPRYNKMLFKSEIMAYRGFFLAKKSYGLGVFWDEGTKHYRKLKIKKVGGQISKSDSSSVVSHLLEDIYEQILKNTSLSNLQEIQRVVQQLKHNYRKKLTEDIKKFRIEQFAIPKKWALRELKTIPQSQLGAMFYNRIVRDVIRPGDSILLCQIQVYHGNVLKKLHELGMKRTSEYQIKNSDITEKLNVISFPVDYDLERIKKTFEIFGIHFDSTKIVEFNIDMKLEPYMKIFNNL